MRFAVSLRVSIRGSLNFVTRTKTQGESLHGDGKTEHDSRSLVSSLYLGDALTDILRLGIQIRVCMRARSGPFKLLTEIVIVSRSRVTARALYATGGDKRHFRLSLTPFLLSLSLYFLLSPSLIHFLCLALYEVRGVRAARKINNYEARGDDSNAEIKVSSGKIILRVLRYSRFRASLSGRCSSTRFLCHRTRLPRPARMTRRGMRGIRGVAL